MNGTIMTYQRSNRHLVALADALPVAGIAQRARAEIAEALVAIDDRRTRVLSHPDLAARLTERPICHEKPDRWNGYVPPAMWREEQNNSPVRAALVNICAEALQRETPSRQ
jgi:hypothetical protein